MQLTTPFAPPPTQYAYTTALIGDVASRYTSDLADVPDSVYFSRYFR